LVLCSLLSVAPNITFFLGLAVKMVDKSTMTEFQARHSADVEAYYFVTELCDGTLARPDFGVGAHSGAKLWQILAQVAAGMNYLYSKSIVHCDLKPANVLATS
jgi:serine/threonine protein kinase